MVFALDRVLKIWVVEVLDLRNRLHIPVVDPWLNLTMAWNEGINFGLFDFGAAGRWVLVGLALAIVAALLLWARSGGWVQAVGRRRRSSAARSATSGTGCAGGRWRISST